MQDFQKKALVVTLLALFGAPFCCRASEEKAHSDPGPKSAGEEGAVGEAVTTFAQTFYARATAAMAAKGMAALKVEAAQEDKGDAASSGKDNHWRPITPEAYAKSFALQRGDDCLNISQSSDGRFDGKLGDSSITWPSKADALYGVEDIVTTHRSATPNTLIDTLLNVADSPETPE